MTGAWVYVKMLARGLSPAQQARNLRVTVVAAAALIVVAYLAGREALADPNPFAGLFARQSPLITLGYAAMISVVFVGLTLCPASVRRPFEGRILRWTGDISYAIYLIHFAVIWFALHEFSLPSDGSVGGPPRLVRARLSALLPLCVPVGALHRAAGAALGAPVRPAGADGAHRPSRSRRPRLHDPLAR